MPRAEAARAVDPPRVAAPAALAVGPRSPRVHLIDPGAEPRVPLRYRFVQGSRESMVMDMTMRMSMALGGMSGPPVAVPPMRMTMEIRSTELTRDGHLRYEFRLTRTEVAGGAGADPAMVALLEQQLAGLIGMAGWGLVDDRGLTLAADVELPPTAGPETRRLIDNMRESFKQISAPFPEEPVGAGARWAVEMSVETPLLRLSQTATYRLLELGGGGGRLAVEIVQGATPQRMTMPGLPEGTIATLDSLASAGAATVNFDLDRLVPRSRATIHTSLQASVQDATGRQQIANDVDLSTVVSPGP